MESKVTSGCGTLCGQTRNLEMSLLFLGKNPVQWFFQTLRTKGPRRVATLIWHGATDHLWDILHGTETTRRIPAQDLETNSDNKDQSQSYGASRARPLMKLFERVGLSRESGFVDLGCGKGRVLMIAVLYGFRRVTGVEFSEPLCELAGRNLEAFSRRRKREFPAAIVHSDVVHYAIQSDDTVFFLYDPFGAKVLAQVLDNLLQSVRAHPREIFVIYNSPRHHDVMGNCDLFSDHRHFEVGGSEYCIYGNAPIPDRELTRDNTRSPVRSGKPVALHSTKFPQS